MNLSISAAMLKGLAHGIFCLLLLSLVVSVLFLLTPLSTGLMSTVAVIILLLAVFYGAMTTTKKLEHRGLLFGLVFGLMFFAVVLILRLFGVGSAQLPLVQLVYCLLGGSLGGLVGIALK